MIPQASHQRRVAQLNFAAVPSHDVTKVQRKGRTEKSSSRSKPSTVTRRNTTSLDARAVRTDYLRQRAASSKRSHASYSSASRTRA